MLTLREIAKAYDGFNSAYFSNTLPHSSNVKFRYMRNKGFLGLISYGPNRVPTIKLNSEKFMWTIDEELMKTLIHEMCHLSMYMITKNTFSSHDVEWVAEMRRVANMMNSTSVLGRIFMSHVNEYGVVRSISRTVRKMVVCDSCGFTMGYKNESRKIKMIRQFGGMIPHYSPSGIRCTCKLEFRDVDGHSFENTFNYVAAMETHSV